MKTDLAKSAKDFLHTLENAGTCSKLMRDRISPEVLEVMDKYSKLISDTNISKGNKVSPTELISCAMVIGYLLKSHVDRMELNKLCQE